MSKRWKKFLDRLPAMVPSLAFLLAAMVAMFYDNLGFAGTLAILAYLLSPDLDYDDDDDTHDPIEPGISNPPVAR